MFLCADCLYNIIPFCDMTSLDVSPVWLFIFLRTLLFCDSTAATKNIRYTRLLNLVVVQSQIPEKTFIQVFMYKKKHYISKMSHTTYIVERSFEPYKIDTISPCFFIGWISRVGIHYAPVSNQTNAMLSIYTTCICLYESLEGRQIQIIMTIVRESKYSKFLAVGMFHNTFWPKFQNGLN